MKFRGCTMAGYMSNYTIHKSTQNNDFVLMLENMITEKILYLEYRFRYWKHTQS